MLDICSDIVSVEKNKHEAEEKNSSAFSAGFNAGVEVTFKPYRDMFEEFVAICDGYYIEETSGRANWGSLCVDSMSAEGEVWNYAFYCNKEQTIMLRERTTNEILFAVTLFTVKGKSDIHGMFYVGHLHNTRKTLDLLKEHQYNRVNEYLYNIMYVIAKPVPYSLRVAYERNTKEIPTTVMAHMCYGLLMSTANLIENVPALNRCLGILAGAFQIRSGAVA